MKIRTQVSLGYLALVALLIAMGLYALFEIGRLHRLHESLTNIDFQARRGEIQQRSQLEKIFDYDLKYWATLDADYLAAVRNEQSRYEEDFEKLRAFLPSVSEQQKAREIQKTYEDYRQVFEQRARAEKTRSVADQIGLDNRKYDLTERLRRLYGELEDATHDAMLARLEESRATRLRVQRMATTAGFLAMALALALSLFLALRIGSPLRKLIEGTRVIASGKFGSVIPLKRSDEFGELARAFNAMSKQLGELDELKKGFVSHVSHELKSPLAPIRETADLLLQEALGPLNEKQRRLVNLSRAKVEELSRRIHDLLDLSRMDAGVMEYQLERTELPPMVHTAVETASPLLHEKNLSIAFELKHEPVAATLDPRRILQVIENLLMNAIKFTREHSTILVRCDRVSGQTLSPVFQTWNGKGNAPPLRSLQPEYAVVTVEDAGPGIPPQETRKIFERFYQSKRNGEAAKGTGLGLTICKNIVEAHDGVVWVDSVVGQGSQFHFALPTNLPPGLRKSRQVV